MPQVTIRSLQMNNGHTIPQLGLGTWKSDPGQVYTAVREALKVGYRHIDCAHIYGNEQEVGEALADAQKEDGIRREDLFITSKLWNSSHLPEDVAPAFETTLNDLRLDYLDLYLMHWPISFKPGIGTPAKREDFLTLTEAPLEDTWHAMEALVDEGRVRSIGVSNFNRPKLEKLFDHCRIRPAMNQVEIHPLNSQPALVEFCRTHDVLITGYSPLGSIDRPEQFKADDEPILLENPVILSIAERLGLTSAQVLIAWALSKDIACIPKSTNPKRIRENFESAAVSLDRGDLEAIDALNRDYRYVGGVLFTKDFSPYTYEDIWDR